MSGDDDNRGEPLYLDVQRFLANKTGAQAVNIAMDLIARVPKPKVQLGES
jgi:hypothetical protein